jgi:hypothetical protein
MKGIDHDMIQTEDGGCPTTIGHINPDEVITLTQIMAVNGHVPCNVGGWRMRERHGNGIVGQVDHTGSVAYVCVSGSSTLCLPNTHPDYTPNAGTVWASVPRPDAIDWRYVLPRYHRRAGWRLIGTAGASPSS